MLIGLYARDSLRSLTRRLRSDFEKSLLVTSNIILNVFWNMSN